ncbi:hypothetical protein [Endozoicomonas sp. GU-1]|uniref:hypothetical protein n=1 Tax=Endozoicomonas sp. GU-1 TaxID=3009078 RepID=UPI0022B53B77|nr:hypothetical protein [Endozoicomonas sp. GU-1]WBA87646.1 hypothetical protein O3276_06375 [Endozoicomonas sp. GU-1]
MSSFHHSSQSSLSREGSEPIVERMIFHNRLRVCLLFLLISLFLTWQLVTGLRMDASFQKMVPLEHPFIQNMLRHMEEGGNSGNTISHSGGSPGWRYFFR